MSAVVEALRAIVSHLDRHGVQWALVGGFAVSARAEPRFTRDVDVAVAVPDDDAAEALTHSLLSEGYTLHATVEQEETGRLATVRLGGADHTVGVVVDLLFASSGVEPEIARDAERLEMLEGLHVPVAQVGHLMAVKVLSRNDATRPQDLADLHALAAVATPADLEVARTALGLITERGYDRGRDLDAGLAAVLDADGTVGT